MNRDQYLYWHRLMGNLWTNTEWYPVVSLYRGLIPRSLNP